MMRRGDYDSYTPVSEQTGVVRWGRLWRVLATDDTGSEAETGPAFSSKAVAIAYALRLVERGEYR